MYKDHLSVVWFLLTLIAVIVGGYGFVALYFPNLYVLGTYEDLYGEWAQTYGFAATLIFSTLNASNAKHTQRWFFIVLASASFYVVMEEISWGQRLIGFTTPQFFHNNSYQDEANFHNLFTGPVEVWTKTILTYIVAVGLVIYGVVLPLLTTIQINIKVLVFFRDRRLLEISPLALIPAFIFAALLEIEPFNFNEAEVTELLVAWSLAFIALRAWLRERQAPKFPWMPYCLLVSVILFAAWRTTQYLLSIPQQQEQINRRLANGYEKFADRYEGYNYLFGQVEMLKKYNDLKPGNTVILRRIADILENLDDTKQAEQYLQAAVTESLHRLAQDSTNIPMYVSLAKSYRKLGDYRAMTYYAQEAYRLAQAKHKTEPKNAGWVYWLAKACEQVNRQSDALHFYRMAHRLEPDSWRYEDAYRQKKAIMLEMEE